MNIDSLPLTAFALEGSGAAARAVGSVHTLTLKSAASGAVAAIEIRPPAAQLSITTVPAEATPSLVLTF